MGWEKGGWLAPNYLMDAGQQPFFSAYSLVGWWNLDSLGSVRKALVSTAHFLGSPIAKMGLKYKIIGVFVAPTRFYNPTSNECISHSIPPDSYEK